MRCENCPAVRTSGYEYPEEYCIANSEDNMVDFADGTTGCKLPLVAIMARIKKYDEADMYQDIGEWYKEQDFKEKTGIDIRDPNGRYVKEAMHCIGMDHRKPYKRHGKLWYRPYRNYFNTVSGDDPIWSVLAKIGYAKEYDEEYFQLTDAGKRWLGNALNVRIKEEEE